MTLTWYREEKTMPRSRQQTIEADVTPTPSPDSPATPLPSDEASAYGTWFALHDAGSAAGASRRRSGTPAGQEIVPSAR